MAWNKPVTNTKPAIQTDEGPYGSTRVKSDDGRYTANSNYKGSEENKKAELQELEDTYHLIEKSENTDELFKKFQEDEQSYSFDKRISVPLFKELIFKTSIGLMIGSETFQVSTSDEDSLLGIDVFAGSKSDNAYLLSDPDVHKIDIKTVKRALGGNPEERDEFYKHPQLSIEVRRVNANNSSVIQNPLKKHANTHYAFQIPYSEKNSYIATTNDVSKCKIIYMEHKTLNELIANNCDEPFIDKCCKFLKYNLGLDYVEENLSRIAHENKYDFKLVSDKYNDAYEITRPLSSDASQTYTIWFGKKRQKNNQKWQIRVTFPSTLCNNRDDIIRKAYSFQKN